MDLIDFNKKDALKEFKEEIKQEYKKFQKENMDVLEQIENEGIDEQGIN